MAMSVTVTKETNIPSGSNIRKIQFSWTSAADGSATGAFQAHGFLVKAVTDPGATAPTDNYDITLVDEFGFDAAEGTLLNRDTANSECVYPVPTGAQTPPLLHGALTFTVADAGDSKVGVCTLYVAEKL